MSLECRLFLLTVQRYDSFRCPAIFSLNFRCSSCDKRPHLRQTDKMGVESVAKTVDAALLDGVERFVRHTTGYHLVVEVAEAQSSPSMTSKQVS